MKRSLALVALASLSFAIPASASAAVLIDTVGQSFQVDYTGKVNGGPTNLISSTQLFTLTSISADLMTYTFDYTLSNTSTVSSRIRSFGFDVLGATLTSLSATGSYPYGSQGDTFPEAVGVLDACFKATSQSNCTGGQGGLTSGTSGQGTFSLTLGAPTMSFSLDNFTTRYQSINPKVNGSDSGVGIGVITPVPEASTWAMMLVGLFGVGATLRRRKMTVSFGGPSLAA